MRTPWRTARSELKLSVFIIRSRKSNRNRICDGRRRWGSFCWIMAEYRTLRHAQGKQLTGQCLISRYPFIFQLFSLIAWRPLRVLRARLGPYSAGSLVAGGSLRATLRKFVPGGCPKTDFRPRSFGKIPVRVARLRSQTVPEIRQTLDREIG